MTKPFGKKELIARIHALLRRNGHRTDLIDECSFDELHFDFIKQEAKKGKTILDFSAREFRLMQYFLQHEGEMISRSQRLDDIWGYEKTPTTRTVDNYILNLRKMIEKKSRQTKTSSHRTHVGL